MQLDSIGFRQSTFDMARVAKIIVEYCADVKAGENVVIVSDDAQNETVYKSLTTAATLAGANASLLLFPTPEWKIPGEWVKTPKAVLSLLRDCDLMICCGKRHLDWDVYDMAEKKTGKGRILYMTGMPEDSLIRCVPIDYQKSAEESVKLIKRFQRAKIAEVTSPSGTKLKINVEGAESSAAKGTFRISGDPLLKSPHGVEFLPAGRLGTWIPPGSTNGIAVIESFLGLGVPYGKVSIEITDGKVTKVWGEGTEQWYIDSLNSLLGQDQYANGVCELGIGTNPSARVNGTYEDYGARGTVRLGFGGFRRHGLPSQFHSDCFFLGATLTLDGEPLIKSGMLDVSKV